MEKRNLRKERIGVVSSNKGEKTITVMVKWKEKHPIYGKFVNKTKKYHAHDENNECSIGDTVRLMETRPLSKTKRWKIAKKTGMSILFSLSIPFCTPPNIIKSKAKEAIKCQCKLP